MVFVFPQKPMRPLCRGMTHSRRETETNMKAHIDRFMQRYHSGAMAFPCDNTSITVQNHSRNISLNICVPPSHTQKHKHNESLLLSMMKQTPLICSRNLTRAAVPPNPSDSPLLRPQGELYSPLTQIQLLSSTFKFNFLSPSFSL